MKACTIVAVSAALFTAKVHAEDFLLDEYFSDSSCTTANLMKTDHTPMGCTGPNEVSDIEGVYYQWACTNANTATRTWYSDDSCTTAHPNFTDTDSVTIGTCESDGGEYRKRTCSAVTKSTSEVFVYNEYASGDTTCAGTATGTSRFFMQCRKSSDYSDGNWTEKSMMYARSGGVVTVKEHDSLDCSGTGTDSSGSPITCGVCTQRDSDNKYTKVTCPAGGITTGAPRGASPGSLLAAAAAALVLAVAGAA